MDKIKGASLFDHIKHIQRVQAPDYFESLTELDRKSFNHFMILRGLSMNPDVVDDVAFLYRYFDTIPSPQFYKLLISFLPTTNAYHPWIKSSKKHSFSKKLVELVSRRFETSEKEAVDYIKIYTSTESGLNELVDICRGYGLTDKEIETVMTNNDE